ncbi:unnamed protein product [Hydatigera taeniaeformis]|uniref:ApaG domain-containing protein n=1 Tax=Hydatigena taeniaeformis TaxID=6205 RepID=A0A0R3WNX9_HYDTA|nr:unnamed protein product [Hydatigera taeniaeformis]
MALEQFTNERQTVGAPTGPFRVAPIGQLQPTQKSPYEPGQLILHRLFGYRGVVLSSWKANVYEMKTYTPENDKSSDISEGISPSFKISAKCEQPMQAYAVLFDIRDAALSSPTMIAGVPFLLNGEGPCEATFNVTDMDYAFHEDLIPYTCTHELPLMNPSFMELMHFDPDVEPKVYPTDRLERILKKYGSLLEVQSVHQETTDGVRVTAVPFLMGRRKVSVSQQSCLWRYLILIENMTKRGMKLCGIYWNFSTPEGRPLNDYEADFVDTPVLPMRSPYFQYHGCLEMPNPSVRASGFFRLEDIDGISVIVGIPNLTFSDGEYCQELNAPNASSDDEPK